MGSKGSGAVAEWRLKPLWDAIDSRQYKPALKLASTLLTKHPDSVYLVVLKALVLERLGKVEEALAVCQQAKEAGPTDDLTLSTLQVVYQRLDCLEQATLCYDLACSKSPNNLELTVGLFNCYVREYSYLKQQQTAIKMYRLFGEERFLLWAVCSIQLQVWCGNGDKALVLLAEALLKKRLDTHGFEELEALLVYISLLEHEEKFKEASDALSSRAGGLFSILSDKLKLEGKLLLLSHQYERAAEVLQEALEISSDDWAVFLQFLDATLEVPYDGAVSTSDCKVNGTVSTNIVAAMSCLSEEEAEKRLQVANAFILKLQSKDQQELRRGPFLGSIEIEKRRFLLSLRKKNSQQKDQYSANDLKVSIVNYFRRFGHMVSFASDVQDYLEFIKSHDSTKLVDLLHEACAEVEDETPVKCMRRKISMHQVEMQLETKAAASDKDLLVYAMDIAKLYVEGLKLSKELDAQESMHGDELLPIATTLLIELFLRTRHPGYVVEAILLLEFGLAVRRYSFQYKIMVINLYSTLFCVSAAFDWYKTLDVKNILIETLSHHILPFLLRSSMLWPELDSLFKETTKFYDEYLKEAANLSILAYRHCNYSKVLEFVQFKERLQHSHTMLVVKAEGTILRLKERADSPGEARKIFESISFGKESLSWATDENLAAMSFNEALETRPWWSPAPGECLLTGTTERRVQWQHMESEKQRSHRQESWHLTAHRRCLLPRLIYLCLGAVSMAKNGEGRDIVARNDIMELKELIEKFGKTFGFSWEKLEELFADLSSSKLHLMDVNVEASDLFSLALFWTAYQIASQPFSQANSANYLLSYPDFLNDLARNFLSELINSVKSSETRELKSPHLNMVSSWSALPSILSLTTESFAWYSLFLQTWLKNLQPVGKIGKKKKKSAVLVEESDGSANGVRSNVLDALNSCTHFFCTELEHFISWLTVLLEISEECETAAYLESITRGRLSENAGGADLVPVPGLVIDVLKSISNATEELGQRIGTISQTWMPDPFLKKVVSGQRATFQGLKDVLIVRLKALQALKV